jgi:hypothetical protein
MPRHAVSLVSTWAHRFCGSTYFFPKQSREPLENGWRASLRSDA